MINLFYKKNGSITVFLSIILVPVLLFMSIMVDGSAYILSKATVESAGELAANAALADYDTVLKDVYGLFAMSQSAEDPQAALKENVMDYFQNSLKANGIIDEEDIWDSETFLMLQDVLDDAMGIEDASIPSLVRVELADTTDVKYIEGSSLANPEILRAQIVEYSQYRAPLNAGLSVLDSLGAFKKVAAQSEVLDSKTRVDDELSDVNDSLEGLYKAINKFDDEVQILQDALDVAANADFDFEDAEKAMKVCHSIILEFEMEPLAKCDTNGNYSSDYDNVIFMKADANGHCSFCKVKNGVESGVSISAYKTGAYLEDIEPKYNGLLTQANELSAQLAAEYDNVVGYATYGGMTIDEPCNTSQTTNPTKLKAAMDKYRELSEVLVDMEECRLATECAVIKPYEYPDWVYSASDEDIADEMGTVTYPVGATEEQKAEIYEDAWDDAEAAVIADQKSDFDDYMQEVFETNQGVLLNSITSGIETFGSNSTKCLNAMKDYQTHYITYHDRLKEYIAAIVNLIDPIADPTFMLAKDEDFIWNGFDSGRKTLAEDIRDRAEQAKVQIRELKAALDSHKADIQDYTSETCDSQVDSFASTMNTKAVELAEKYNEEDVDEIVKQVNAIEKYLISKNNPMGVEATLASYQLGGHQLANFFNGYPTTNLNVMEGLIDAIVDSYKADGTTSTAWVNAQSSTYYQLDSNTLFKTDLSHLDTSVLHNLGANPDNVHNAYNTDQTCYLKRIGQANVRPASMPAGEESVNIPAFYFYLITCFGVTGSEDECLVTKDNMESYQEDQEKEAEGKTGASDGLGTYEMSLLDNVPTQGLTGDPEAPAPSEDGDSPFEFFRRAVATFQDIVLAVTNLNGDNIVETMLVEEYIMNNFSRYSDITSAQVAAQKGEEAPEARKTYSNVEINKENNKMYGCEIEYILYGKKGSAAKKFLIFNIADPKGPEINVNCAKEDIFAVRMMFNTVFAMTDAQIDNETLPPAMAIQAASSGVFPYQLAQTIIKLCLALAESNYDVDRIVNQNIAMPLIKTKQTWKFQLSGMKDLVQDKVDEVVEQQMQAMLDSTTETVKKGLQDAIDGAEKDLIDMVSDVRNNALVTIRGCIDDNVNAVMECYTSTIESYYQQILIAGKKYSRDELVSMCEEAANEYLDQIELNTDTRGLLTDVLVPELTNNLLPAGGALDTSLQEIETLVTTNANDAKDLAEQLGVNFSNTMKAISQQAQETVGKIENQIIETTTKIADEVGNATLEVVNDMYDEANSHIDDLSAQISGTINSKLDEYFPSSSVTTNVEMSGEKTSSSLGTSFVMGYDDYIRVFLLIKLLGTQSDVVITRVADVIQVNINEGLNEYETTDYKHPVKGQFKMDKANTYMEIEAKVKVEPLLISQDWFENMSGGRIDYLKYDYSTIAGY